MTERPEGFEPGALVVCIFDGAPEELGWVRPPGYDPRAKTYGIRRGLVYTIRAAGPDPYHDGLPCLWLEEVRNVDERVGIECGYWQKRFRPLRKLSVESFLKADVPVREDA